MNDISMEERAFQIINEMSETNNSKLEMEKSESPEKQAKEINTFYAYSEASKDKNVKKNSVDSAKEDLNADSEERKNKSIERKKTSLYERLKNVTSAKIQDDEAHCRRHIKVLTRWGITEVIPKGQAIAYEIVGVILQALVILTFGWIIYCAKFLCEILTGLSKGVWAIIGTIFGCGVLSLVVWGIYKLFIILQGI